MNDETELNQRPHRFAAEKIPTLEVTVWRLDANAKPDTDPSNGDQPMGGSPGFSAQLIDFSRKGLKLALPFSAQFEEVIAIRLEFIDINYAYMGQATVRHIREENDLWIAGCSIEPYLRDVLIDHLVTLSGKERRQHPRTPINGEGWVRRAGDVEGIPATILNISRGGLCSTVSEPLTVGERVQFLTHNRKGDLETIAVQIRWQSEINGGHKIGCSFSEAKGYRKLLYCLTNETALSVLIKKDSTKWYVLAAAMLAMSVPPAVHFITKAINPNNVESAAVVPIDHSEIDHSATSPVADEPPLEDPMPDTLADTMTLANPMTKKPAKRLRTKTPSPVETQPTKETGETVPATGAADGELASTERDLNDPFVGDNPPPEPTFAGAENVVEVDVVPDATELAGTNTARPDVTSTVNATSNRRDSGAQRSVNSSSRRISVPTVNDVRTDHGVPDVPFEPITQ